MFSNNILQFEKYMNEEGNETFIDIREDKEEMGEDEAGTLFRKMLSDRGIDCVSEAKTMPPEDLMREFRRKTNLSLRNIAGITGLNKDKINKIIKP